jgi:glycerophosphoryl diester phosphodiesterase
MKPPLVIAHRGASHVAPENTLAAFRLAWEQGADAIETDLRLTADGAVVAFHDANGRRLLRDRRRICDLTLAELRQLDAGAWKAGAWRGERVPELGEVLETAPSHGQIVLELKENIAAALATALPDPMRPRTTIIAFDAETITHAKRLLPECRALWLFGNYGLLPSRARGRELAARVRDLGVDGVDLRHDRRLNQSLLVPLRAEGRTVFTYTVNQARSVRRCARLGLDGVTTDRPGDTRRWLGISA